MTHIDERTLELYVLGDQVSHATAEKIEAHLRVCSGCRAMTDTIRRFYADAAEDRGTRAHHDAPRAVGLQRRITSPVFAPLGSPATIRPGGWVWRTAHLARRHPVAAAGTTLAIIAVAGVLLTRIPLKTTLTGNPVEYSEDYVSSTIEVRNSASEALWRISVPELNDYRQAIRDGWRPVQLADLDGDGRNEVITCFRRVAGLGTVNDRLLIFRSDGTVDKDIRVGSVLNYRNRTYPNDFHIVDFLAVDLSGTQRPEILVLADHNHSPSIIYRIDGSGQIVGTYRHFGHLRHLFNIQPGEHPTHRIIAAGFDDTDESKPSQAVVIGLDPSLLIGDGESSHGRGFGCPASPAELHYVNIPPSELTRALGRSVILALPRVVGLPSSLGFRIMALGSDAKDPPAFEYVFDQNLRIIEVKSSNETRLIFDQHGRTEGLPGPFYDVYLKHLAHQVRYWSGSTWVSKPTPVQH